MTTSARPFGPGYLRPEDCHLEDLLEELGSQLAAHEQRTRSH